MAEFILCAIITLSFASLYVSRQKRSVVLFDAICDWYIVFVAIHACYALIVRYWFAEYAFAGLIAPFGLVYGPFFFFGFKSLLDERLDKSGILVHSIPAILFWVLYLMIVISGPDIREYLLSFYVILYAFTAVSLIGYAIWAVLFAATKGFLEKGNYAKEKQQFLKTSGYTLIVMAGLFTILIASDAMPDEDVKLKLPGIVVYSGMLASLIFAYNYKIKNLFSGTDVANKAGQKVIGEKDQRVIASAEAVSSGQKYLKSGLTTEIFEDYKQRLDVSFETERVYLDSELSLEGLAKKLKMPPHHLTQLFNVHIGENFNQYLNKYRIKNAGELLEKSEGASMEDVAFRSGFNNKVSFNRHFKIIMGCTPKEYVNKVKKQG